jgi:hypothetical protein
VASLERPSKKRRAGHARAKNRSKTLRRAAFALWALAISVALSGCPCVNSIVNNDPNLRWWAFKTYGVDRLCPEMLKASVPLKLQEQSPTIGRYFPNSCSYQINEQNRTVIVSVGGGGYAYLPTVKRIGFTLNVTVEYAFDFRLTDDGAWVWGQLSRTVSGPDFRMTGSENKLVDLATVVTPAGTAANLVGSQVVTGFIARGFTVIETDSGKEFSLGILPPGKHPFKPVQVDSEDEAYTFANETVDVYSQQRDFLGPYEIADDDQVIRLKGNLVGNGVDVFLVQKTMGDLWRDNYQNGTVGPPPGNPVSSQAIPAGPFMRKFKAPPGLYYLVVDNTSTAGATNPPFVLPNPLFESAARMTYVSQLIEE